MTTKTTTRDPRVHRARTVDEALERLGAGDAEVLAGGTWIMRSGVRGDDFAAEYVLVSKLPELQRLEFADGGLLIGAGVTHDRLATFLDGHPEFSGLHRAAGTSANPAIRRLATVGGNLCTTAFPAADLVPALLAAAAEVELAGPAGTRSIPLHEFLAARATLLRGSLVTGVTVREGSTASVHERLTMRQAGDYPVAIVDMRVAIDDRGNVGAASVAVGSVEAVPFSWTDLADELVGSPLDVEAAREAATRLATHLDARDGVEAAGWYRLEVLPGLVASAVRNLQRMVDGR